MERGQNMSATTQPSTESKEERLKQFLLRKAEDGEVYFKSKFISDIEERFLAGGPGPDG